MKKILLIFAVALIGLTASAQRHQGQRGGDPRQGLERMAEKMAKEMKLDNSTKEWFVALYTEYRDTLFSLQRQQRIKNKDLEKMDDAAVTQLIEQSLERDNRAVEIKRAYLAKFRERLSEKQVYRAMMGGMRQRGGDMQRQGRGQNNDEGFSGGPGGFPGGDGGGFGGGPDF